MSHKGNVQLLIVITAKPDQVAEGDRIFAEHAKWMPGTHHFILSEVYATEAGVADHLAQSQASFPEFESLVKWVGECNSTVILGAGIINSLW